MSPKVGESAEAGVHADLPNRAGTRASAQEKSQPRTVGPIILVVWFPARGNQPATREGAS